MIGRDIHCCHGSDRNVSVFRAPFSRAMDQIRRRPFPRSAFLSAVFSGQLSAGFVDLSTKVVDLINRHQSLDRQVASFRFAHIPVDQRIPLFPRLIVVGEFDPLGNGGMRRLEDEEESIPFGRNITGLNIPNEHRRGLVILMSQFKPEAVGFELDMAGEQIEKRQNGNPEEG